MTTRSCLGYTGSSLALGEVNHWKWPAQITLAAVFTEQIYATKAISYCRIDVSHNKELASHETDQPQKRDTQLL